MIGNLLTVVTVAGLILDVYFHITSLHIALFVAHCDPVSGIQSSAVTGLLSHWKAPHS